MNIIVCVKQVPSSTNVEMDPETGTLKRDKGAAKLNPYDLFALETAISLAEATDGHVTAVSMGPNAAVKALYESIYMGADEGVLITDRRFAGADVLATARTIAGAIDKIGNYDIIICGKQTTDGDTAQTGAEMAEFLGLPHIGAVNSIEPDGDGVKLVTTNEAATTVMHAPMPCLVCLNADVNTPRLPSYKRKTALGDEVSKLITTLTLDDYADSDPSHYGLSGSPTKVERIFPPTKNTEKLVFEGTPDEQTDRIMGLLRDKKIVG